MMTFCAPASMCALALVASVKKPVDSMTICAPHFFHGMLPGSRSALTWISRPSITNDFSCASTSPG